MATRQWAFMTLVAAGIAGCEDPKHRELVGTYDFTTTVETYNFRIPGSAPGVDCVASAPYCTRTEDPKGATLSGTMTIGGAGEENENGNTYIPVNGTATGQSCSAVDKEAGCTGLSTFSLVFPTYPGLVTDTWVNPKLAIGTTGPAVSVYSPPLEGDSLVGTFSFYQPLNGEPAVYAGHIVARKRR